MATPRDHGGGVDAALAHYGGVRGDWIDLSTGINPVPYPVGPISHGAWSALPDYAAQEALLQAARRLWAVPKDAAIVAAPGASALIARLPALFGIGRVHIPQPTYNEHAAAFRAHGWDNVDHGEDVRVLVHPNNPTGRWATQEDLTAPHLIIDESFADVEPGQSLVHMAGEGEHVILKSFGKFWGLAGLRLGFAIAPRPLARRMSDMMGPWAVSGPALQIATIALTDLEWATQTRARLIRDAARLDALMTAAGAEIAGGTPLFRLYDVNDAAAWQDRLAQRHIWTRIFPYSKTYLRLGLPGPDQWDRLEAAL